MIEAAKRNLDRIERLISKIGMVTKKTITIWSEDGLRRVGSRNAARLFSQQADLEGYTDIVVDISALSRTLYVPLVAKLLTLIDNWSEPDLRPNLHVLVADDPDLDRRIKSEALDDDATYLHGFGSGIELEATAGVPRVWIPVLGEGKIAHVERIYDLVSQDDSPLEIAPALPFQCSNPRRTDDLMMEYRTSLFDNLRVEASNVIHVPESNPFGAYRQIRAAVARYSDALEPLGGCKIVLSVLSSKLLSLGALMAAYELKQCGQVVAIAHVQASEFVVETTAQATVATIYDAWLAGECYDAH